MRQVTVDKLIGGLTLMVIIGGLAVPKHLTEMYLAISGVALILAGVPHGASDFLLFRQMMTAYGRQFQAWRFFAGYVLLIIVYMLVWWALPLVAFALFLALSAYHFGQSNWPHVHFPNKIVEKLTMFLWGAAVIGVPVLFHFDQSSIVVLEMTGVRLVLSDTVRIVLIAALIAGPVGNTILLYYNEVLTAAQLKRELRNFLLLMLLFFTTPLMVGFGVYFVLWHSLNSVLDQLSVLRSLRPGFSFKKYLKSTIPLSLIAFAGLGFIYFFMGDYFDQGQNLGALFLFVSLITVPHAVLMEWLYKIGGPVLGETRYKHH